MRKLVVSLDYSTSDLSLPSRPSALRSALPIKVLDEGGTILGGALASLDQTAEFDLPDELETVFVRLTWPSGKSQTKRAKLLTHASTRVVFSDSRISRNEWAAWAIPLLNPKTSRIADKGESGVSIEEYLKVWLRMWRFANAAWHETRIAPQREFSSNINRQVDLQIDAQPHLVQIGGANVPWRFVALPSGGPCRILLTPNDSKDPRADALRILVTSHCTDAENLLEFLARDAVGAASTMANSAGMAVSLFEEKQSNPIAAVAGAYYLLRVGEWDRVPLAWWENLSTRFPWIPDTAILHCTRLLRAGLGDENSTSRVLQLFKQSIDSGWPTYGEGMQLLQEASSLLRQVGDRRDAEYFARIDSLTTAKAWAGAALSFFGREPSSPSAVLWVGMPNAPRRRRLSRPEWLTESIRLNQEVVDDSNRTTASELSRQMSSLLFAKDFAAIRPLASSSGAQRAPALEMSEPQVPSYRIATHTPKDWLLLGDIGAPDKLEGFHAPDLDNLT